MNSVSELLKKAGYSDKAIDFYINEVNVGELKNPNIHYTCKGSCSDTIELFLRIESDMIIDAKFKAIGCAATFSAASAVIEMVIGQRLDQAKLIHVGDIVDYLEGVPEPKLECTLLANKTVQEAIDKYMEYMSSNIVARISNK